MLESLFRTLCKIGTFFNFSWNTTHSPSSSTKNGTPAATSGDYSPIQIGDNHFHLNHFSESDTEAKSRFYRRLVAVAHELPTNFRNVGNVQNPFQTQALEKLVHEEPLIHEDFELFQKASKCLNTARILSTSNHTNLKPSKGQSLMKDLSHYISEKYKIKGPD